MYDVDRASDIAKAIGMYLLFSNGVYTLVSDNKPVYSSRYLISIFTKLGSIIIHEGGDYSE